MTHEVGAATGASAHRFGALEVKIGRQTIRLLSEASNEEAIACVEQHLRGTKDRAALDVDGPLVGAGRELELTFPISLALSLA